MTKPRGLWIASVAISILAYCAVLAFAEGGHWYRGKHAIIYEPIVTPVLPPSGTRGFFYHATSSKFSAVNDTGVIVSMETEGSRKTADQVNTTTTFADVSDLTFPLLANTNYSFLCELIYITAAPNTALQVSVNGPALPIAIRWTVHTVISTSASHYYSQNAYDATGNPATAANPPASLPLRLVGVLENGTNAGTLALRMRSEVAASSVTIQRGSWCGLFVTKN